MPNTLAHLGVQTLITRTASRDADLKWIALGCIIPDLPWIARRVVRALDIDVPPYELALYTTVQATLLLSVILCAALSLVSSKPRSVFLILSTNVLMHLLLDALQIKWGNGVHLFAPFSWSLTNIGLFWTDSLPTVVLTAFGVAYIGFISTARPGKPVTLQYPEGGRRVLVALLLLGYVLGPIPMLSGPMAADNHSLRTLQDVEQRPGKAFSFDRNTLKQDENGSRIVTLVGEELFLQGETIEPGGTISGKGRFSDTKTIELESVRVHWPLFRDVASAVGLLVVAAIWFVAIRRQFSTVNHTP